ncbi:glutamate--tRNA ligase, partial [Leptospira sp. 96542]|nr:glutamate--tRNA ligase [Leptospira sp. 96542]
IEEFFLESLQFENAEAKQLALDGNGPKVCQTFYNQVKSSDLASPDSFKETMAKTGEISGEKGRTLFMPIRAITTGKSHGLELPILFHLLGKEKLLHRMESLANEIELQL